MGIRAVNYAVVIEETGLVENMASWDGVTVWSPGPGRIALRSDEAQIGGTYAGGGFTPPADDTEAGT